MSIEIRMPALSPTMEKGNLAKWLIKQGDSIKSGDIIAEIETDKATMEVEAADDGTVGQLVVDAGTADVPVGTVIAVLLGDGEAPAPAPAPTKTETAQSTSAKTAAKSNGSSSPAVTNDVSHDRSLISPLALRIAQQSGIEISSIQGSGPGGRIIKRDLHGAAPVITPQTITATAQAPTRHAAPVFTAPDMPHEEMKLSGMRRVIAERLTDSKQNIPHFYMTVDVRMDKLLTLRKDLNDDGGVKLSVNDLIIKALAVALQKTPDANVQFGGDKLYRLKRVDVSVAVAIEGGLVTPVVRDAAAKGLAAISNDMRDMVEKAKSGKLLPEDYKGGGISLSNLGMFGIKQFEAVINPPQAAILAVGASDQRAVVTDGTIQIATIMEATLSCDHRAIDGAVGAALLCAFKAIVEDPLKLML